MECLHKVKVKPNHQKRTYTIREYYYGDYFAKYRTIKMSKEEFASCLNNTEKDWRYFLHFCHTDYYRV